MSQQYVVGFCFSADGKWVTLIRKARPAWQAGLVNGIGGKVEPYMPPPNVTLDEDAICAIQYWENPEQAMAREYEEETGVKTSPSDWEKFAVTYGPCREDSSDWVVHYFRMFNNKVCFSAETKTDEIVFTTKASWINRAETVSHLQWMIPMALQRENRIYEIREISQNDDL